MDKDLIKLIENTGFTEKESMIYLALLGLGQGDVTDISKVSGLKRSIIYVVLEGLIKRGYVSELPDKKVNTYQAIDPSAILFQLRNTTKNFTEMLPILRTLHNKGSKKPKISYYDTLDGIWNVYEEMSNSKEAFFITGYSKIEEYFPGAVKKWINDYKKGYLKVKGRHLVPNNDKDVRMGREFKDVENQQVKIMPNIDEYDMDFTIFDDKLGITSLEESPFIVVIESEGLVESMKPFFELAWEKGKEIK